MFEAGEPSILCPDLINKTLEKVHIIRNRSQTTYSRQKSYVNHRIRDLEFEKYDKVYLKISPVEGVVRFCKKGKLSPHYMGPYEIFARVGKAAYEFKHPSELSSIHQIFHVFMLMKCIGDPKSIITIEGLGVKDNISYGEFPVQIINRQFKKLRNKKVVFVKV